MGPRGEMQSAGRARLKPYQLTNDRTNAQVRCGLIRRTPVCAELLYDKLANPLDCRCRQPAPQGVHGDLYGGHGERKLELPDVCSLRTPRRDGARNDRQVTGVLQHSRDGGELGDPHRDIRMTTVCLQRFLDLLMPSGRVNG